MNRIILLFGILLFTNNISTACKCQDYGNSFLHLLESNHVFLATIMSVSDCGDNNKYEYELYIESNYKGTLPETKKVYTDCVTSCAFQLEKGSRVIFFTDLTNDNINFCDLQIAFSDANFILTKKYLDKIKYTKLDYLELYERKDGNIFRSKMMVQDGFVNGVVNIYDKDGNTAVKGLVKNGKMEGYYEIRNFSDNGEEVWTGDYKDGNRDGNWVYKYTSNIKNARNQFILYTYEKGEVIKRSDLAIEAQLEEYEPKKEEEKKN